MQPFFVNFELHMALDTIVRDIRNRTDIALVGISGGADSTLVATLCAQALGTHNVFSLSMPYGDTDVKTFNKRSESLAEKLGIGHKVIPIKDMVDTVTYSIPLFHPMTRLNQGNLRSRMRAVTLYTYCCQLAEATGKRVRVVGTGNLSEDYIGYDTKGGDALADFFPIGQLYKKEVYDALDILKKQGFIDEEHIDRVPSAGLWEGQTDESELGYTYDEMAPAIRYCMERERLGINPLTTIVKDITRFATIVEFVWNRHLNNKHKHEAAPATNLGR